MKTLLATIATVGLVACQSNAVKSVKGEILDATMNTVMISDATNGDTIVFSTMNADKVVDGILIGDSAEVFFKGDLAKGGSGVNTATKVIVTPAPVEPLCGSWVEPIPGMNGVQGIKIDEGGAASSINMSTLVYEKWQRNGDTLTLDGKSIGNGQTIDFTQIANIDKLDADSLVITVNGAAFRYAKQK